jgi:hypothetical protein
LVLPLLISAAVAPLVLLRSEPATSLGVKWALWFEKYVSKVGEDNPLVVVMFFSILPVSIAIRIVATLFYLRSGIRALPRNFRRVVLCTSPAQVPELVPGLETSSSELTFSATLKDLLNERSLWWPLLFVYILILFLPAWLYRITIKSTAWFWWPLAFLGGDLKQVQNPALFHWQVMGSLWAKTSIALAILSLAGFVAVNFVFDGTVFERNPLLTPVGYLLLIDWRLWPWQMCALLAAVLSILIVYMVNDVSGQYRIAQEHKDDKLLEKAKSQYGWIERLTRFRFLLLLGFWGLVGTHAFLYANVSQGWYLSFPPEMVTWMVAIYADRFPGYNQ